MNYQLFETEITKGDHKSLHYSLDKFEGELDKGLDLSKYEISMTALGTHIKDTFFHIHHLDRNGDYLAEDVLDAYKINVDFPVIYFTRRFPYIDNFKCGFHLDTFKKFKSSFFRDTVKIIKLFKGHFIDVFIAGDFTKDGEFIDDSINIEIIPFQLNHQEIITILLKNFEIDKDYIMRDAFLYYDIGQFAWHIKIKLYKDKKPVVKFYRTSPYNPYLKFRYYDHSTRH